MCDQLFDRFTASTQCARASREIATTLASGTDIQPWQLIAERARELTGAEQAFVLCPTDSALRTDTADTFVVATAVGAHVEKVLNAPVAVRDSTLGKAFSSGTPMITDSLPHPIRAFINREPRSTMVLPLRAADTTLAVVALARSQQQPPFEPDNLDVTALASATAHARERELAVLADRERIAHDLHDHVIQKLFAAGMDLQGTIARTRSAQVVDRLTRTVDDLQAIIDDIRTVVFDLTASATDAHDFRHRIQNAVTSLTDDRDLITTLRMSGPISVVASDLAENAVAVLTEAVSNTVRHSGANHLTVQVDVADEVILNIVDDGCGIPSDNRRRSGLANMAHRAEQLGGTCHITSPNGGGTHVHWRAALFNG